MTTLTETETLPAMRSSVEALRLTVEGVRLLDQTALPLVVRYLSIQTVSEMADAITGMLVRGAPAIGIAAAYGVVLSVRSCIADGLSLHEAFTRIERDIDILSRTRPTAVNLFWALAEMRTILQQRESFADSDALLERVTAEALRIHQADVDACRHIGEFGASVIPDGAGILTHCNAGALATGGYGTALGVVRSAFARDPQIRVYADETRPRLQGARLTTWELAMDGIPVTLVTDGMSGSLMRLGRVNVVVVGADRITANGDVANKIGTYNLALVAHAHQIPFYVAAPLSTFDPSLSHGDAIPIEERHSDEIAVIHKERICAASGVDFYNPAFDVTPARYITGIITEKGLIHPPYEPALRKLLA